MHYILLVLTMYQFVSNSIFYICLLKNIFLYKFVRAAESILALLILHIISVGEEVEGVVVLLGLDGLALQLIALVPLKGGDIL